ncbi:MAG: sulfatase-like hydrolase/transferase [Blastochloris sp.]|nr:sulfatase-like hydrolase/transferase [Blastochloris sp.]
MADQLRLDHVGFASASRLATPNIDRIAGSCAFTGCITPSPMCQPARAALLTGKYPHQIGLTTMSGDLSREHPTYAQALSRSGYQTAVFGKLHLLQGWDWYGKIKGDHDLVAMNDEMRAYGFDQVWECSGKFLVRRNRCHWRQHLEDQGLWEAYLQHLKRCAGNRFKVEEGHLDEVQAWPLREEDHPDVLTATKTVEHLERLETERPFFVFTSFCGPHVPYDPPARYLEEMANVAADPLVDPEQNISGESARKLVQMQRAYKAMVKLIDDQVGRILDTLERRGLMDNTVIAFCSDHGEMLGDHGLLQKGYPYWQSLSVPLAILHPEHRQGWVNHSPVELTDLTATLLDVAGLDPQQVLAKAWPSYHNIVPGRSLLPILRGESEAVRDWAFAESDACWHSGQPDPDSNWQVLQNGQWHYQRRVQWRGSNPQNYLEERLFDRIQDPEYQRDISGEAGCAAVLETCRRMRDFIMSTTPPAQSSWAPLT